MIYSIYSNRLGSHEQLVQYAVIASYATLRISGAGYVIWYRVLREISAITASTLQISAPVIAAMDGKYF